MSAQVNKVLASLKPVCNIVKSNSNVLSIVMFCILAIAFFPIELLVRSNFKNNMMGKLKNILLLNPISRIFIFLLFICLYMNGDLKNMILLLYLITALNPTY